MSDFLRAVRFKLFCLFNEVNTDKTGICIIYDIYTCTCVKRLNKLMTSLLRGIWQILELAQKTQGVGPMLAQCYDAGSTSAQHWANASCLLGDHVDLTNPHSSFRPFCENKNVNCHSILCHTARINLICRLHLIDVWICKKHISGPLIFSLCHDRDNFYHSSSWSRT